MERQGPGFELVGPDNLRVVTRETEVVGCASLVPMGQFFGGRSVPMTGIAGVAVAPQWQRRGAATELMRGVIQELAAAKVGLSTLYASSLPLYRKVGYECGGSHFVGRPRPEDLRTNERGGTVEPVTIANERRIKALYAAHSPSFNGFLERGDYIWTRLIRRWAELDAYCMLVCGDDGRAEGYIAYRRVRDHSYFNRIVITDLFAVSAWGYRRLWSFVGDLCTSVVTGVEFNTAPHDPALLVLPNPHFPIELTDNWMLRVVDVPAAFDARGYPPRLNAELDLDIYDDVVDRNNGAWRLVVRQGRGTIERGGTGALRVDASGLAALYSGFVDATALAVTGRVQGTPSALAIAGSIFAGPLPWMREAF